MAPVARRIGPMLAGLLLFGSVVLATDFQRSGASFVDADSNPSNSWSASPGFTPGLRTGTYTGNATDQREITGLPFRPDWVLIKSTTAAGPAVMRTRTMTGDQTKPLNGTVAIGANRIESLNAAGFTVGTDASVNSNGVGYQWIAGSSRAGASTVGSYSGDGTSGRAITLAAGFAPDAVIVMPSSANSTALRIDGMADSFRMDGSTGLGDGITSLDSRSFTVGTNATTNASGITYHYLALAELAGQVDVGTYTGTNANRTVTGLGFNPNFVLIRGSSATTARTTVFRGSAFAANNSALVTPTANATNAITAFGPQNFSLGVNANVNANSEPYAYLAMLGT